MSNTTNYKELYVNLWNQWYVDPDRCYLDLSFYHLEQQLRKNPYYERERVESEIDLICSSFKSPPSADDNERWKKYVNPESIPPTIKVDTDPDVNWKEEYNFLKKYIHCTREFHAQLDMMVKIYRKEIQRIHSFTSFDHDTVKKLNDEIDNTHDDENIQDDHAYHLYTDGKILSTKGRKNYDQRREFTTKPSLNIPPWNLHVPGQRW